MATDTTSDARVVDGSDGLLIEVDGQIVPNYDATLRHFDEGDVVTGKVVRIDNDEVRWLARNVRLATRVRIVS